MRRLLGGIFWLSLACSGAGTAPLEERAGPPEQPPAPVEPGGVAMEPATEVSPEAGQSTPAPQATTKAVQGLDAVTSDRTVVVDRSSLERKFANTTALSDVVKFTPSIKGKNLDGFKIVSIPAGSPIAELGLQPGDIVHSVNGVPLGSPSGAMLLLKKLEHANAFAGVVTRGGEKHTLTVVVK